MQPQPVALCDRGDLGEGIKARRRSGAERRNYAKRFSAGSEIGGDRGFKGIRTHSKVIVDRNVADVAAAYARDKRRSVDGEVSMLGSIEDQRRGCWSRGLPGGDDGVQSGGGGRVVD